MRLTQKQKKLLVERAWDTVSQQINMREAALRKELTAECERHAKRITARLQKELAEGTATVVHDGRVRYGLSLAGTWEVRWSDASRKHMATIAKKLKRQQESNERWRYDFQRRVKRLVEEFEFNLEFSGNSAKEAQALLDDFAKKLEAFK